MEDLPECIYCQRPLTSEEMASHLEHQDGGDNCWIDDEHGPVPCCNRCNKYKQALCEQCGSYWTDHSLEWADLSSGETVLICHECHLCSECDEQFGHRIDQENWSPEGNLVCDDCRPKTCCMCHQIFRYDDIYMEKSQTDKVVFMCEYCKECGTCAASLADRPIAKYNWDSEGDLLCERCLATQ